MSDVFPKWTNKLPLRIIIGLGVLGAAVTMGVTYYFTPKYTRVGYQPVQPVAFSHDIHAGQLGLDCRYCHTHVEKSWFSNIPATATCMNCHNQVLKDDPKLALVRESYYENKPIEWVQIHKLPDYVYFNHAVHVSCVECHGRVDEMDEVYHAKPFSMGFCLECHRNPETRLRPPDKITDLKWKWNEDPKIAELEAHKQGKIMVEDWNIKSSDHCSACHR